MRNNPASFILASFLVVAAAAGTAVSTTGCDGGGGSGGAGGSGGSGGTGGSGGSSACFDYSSFDGTSPAVSFQTDVLPFFQNSCGVSTGCHGDINQPNENRPYLGPNKMTTATADDITAIFAAIVDVSSYYEPGMSLVKPGEPENSFLMYKLDDTLECDKLQCSANNDCGGIMPQGAQMPMAERENVRLWIAQGAQNN